MTPLKLSSKISSCPVLLALNLLVVKFFSFTKVIHCQALAVEASNKALEQDTPLEPKAFFKVTLSFFLVRRCVSQTCARSPCGDQPTKPICVSSFSSLAAPALATATFFIVIHQLIAIAVAVAIFTTFTPCNNNRESLSFV